MHLAKAQKPGDAIHMIASAIMSLMLNIPILMVYPLQSLDRIPSVSEGVNDNLYRWMELVVICLVNKELSAFDCTLGSIKKKINILIKEILKYSKDKYKWSSKGKQ